MWYDPWHLQLWPCILVEHVSPFSRARNLILDDWELLGIEIHWSVSLNYASHMLTFLKAYCGWKKNSCTKRKVETCWNPLNNGRFRWPIHRFFHHALSATVTEWMPWSSAWWHPSSSTCGIPVVVIACYSGQYTYCNSSKYVIIIDHISLNWAYNL